MVAEVKEEIRSFDASRISTENRVSVEKLIANKSDSFDAKAAKRASVAAAPLASWVSANVKYSHVLDKIKPLEREQSKLKQNLANAEAQLGELSAGLLDVDAAVAKLKQQLAAYTKEAAEIEIDLNKAQETLASAEGLVGKLDDEYQRWQQQLKELSQELEKLPDNCSLASALITYLSDESEEERRNILNSWIKSLNVNWKFDFEEFLSTEREHLQWQSEGLSYDKLSLQNAIIILNAKIVPLLIDPTSAAVGWLKNHLKKRQIESTTQNSAKFNTSLELAVRFGKVLIVEVDAISPGLFPILREEYVFQGERKLIMLNGKLVDYHNDFLLVLSSRNEQLKVSADVAAVVSVMNFSVTHAGLAEQLLSAAIRQENPQLEERRQQLSREREELQEKQHQLQNQLLEDLASSSGDILQNANLLSSLNETKSSSLAITQALRDSSEVHEKLKSEYEVYQDISMFGSSLYFACSEFSKYNVLYVLSNAAYVKLFLTSLQTFHNLGNGIEMQKKHLFSTVYDYVARGVFKDDRLMLATHLMAKLFSIPPLEYGVFLGQQGNARSEAEHLPLWIPKQCIYAIQNIQMSLPELYKTLRLDEQTQWSGFMSAAHCEKEIPCKLSDFQKVLIVQALRPDRAYSILTSCVLQTTGLRSTDPTVFDLAQIYRDSTSREPILVLVVSGADPSVEIQALAENSERDLKQVAMGEGQEAKALAVLQATAVEGHWLILKNLHLVTGWLAVLCQTLQSLRPHDNFRLWLVTEPKATFNFVLAQNSLKVVYEAPQGIKNNLQRTYNTWGSKYVENLNGNSARIFFVLACVHAILQERRRYVPQGWSKWYEFSDTDLATCVRLVEDLWQVQSPQVQWKFISGLCSDAVYGGRIENVDDMRILGAYLREYLSDGVLSTRWSPLGVSKINLPSSAKFQEYINAIKQLPERDSPSYFGLPDNIDRAWEKQTASKIVARLKDLSIPKEVLVKFDREIWHKGLAPFMSLWKKLNQGHDFVRMALPSTPPALSSAASSGSLLKTFVAEEFQAAIRTIQQIHKSFALLNKICKGNVLPDDLDVGYSLLNYQIPKLWVSLWDGPEDPSKYLRSIVQKAASISVMVDQTDKFQAVNLSNLLHPSAFLASYKEEHSRLSNIPMDQLELDTNWNDSRNSVVLKELLIEGGLFDGRNLKTCMTNSENINPAPDCYISWKEKKTSIKDEKCLEVPVYYTSSRKKQLTCFQISCDAKDKDRWIQAGIAFYLEY